MEAFVPSSSFLQRNLRISHHRQVSPTLCPRQSVIYAKKSSERPQKPKGKAPKSSPTGSSSFAGMAAGPGSPSRSLSRSPAEADAKREGDVEMSDDSQTENLQSAPRAVRALGQKKPRQAPEIRAKTAADFIAEGVEDDVDDVSSFAEEDIRFGIADLADPFKEDADAEEISMRKAEEESERESIGKPADVSGDGGVTKRLITPGTGDVVYQGAQVTVEYTGKLEDGSVFDSSRNREGGFSFELGAGRVIKGWEAGVATMRRGEVAEFTISSLYAYGRRGMPPVIPGNATLKFEIELIDFKGGEKEEIKRVADFNPGVARTPEEIAKEYGARLETREERRKGMSLFDRFYIISPFASQTGQRPPWWINPNITFVGIAVFCAIGFYLVILSGAIHVGYVDQPVDVNIFK